MLEDAVALINLARSFAPAAPPPGLHLSPIQVAALERALGSPASLTAPGLIHAVERLTALQVGELSLPITPGQLAELQHRARKRGRTVQDEMKAVVARIHDELFHQGG